MVRISFSRLVSLAHGFDSAWRVYEDYRNGRIRCVYDLLRVIDRWGRGGDG